jgi:hypothetical protein
MKYSSSSEFQSSSALFSRCWEMFRLPSTYHPCNLTHPISRLQIYSLSAKLLIIPSAVGSYSFNTTSSPSRNVLACTKTFLGFA